MNTDIDSIIAEIRDRELNCLNPSHINALADAYEEILAAMRKVAQERQDALAEFRLARNRADALGEMLTAAENAAGCSVESPSLVLAIKKLVMERKQIASMLGVTDTQIDDWTVRGLLFDGITKVIASKAKDMADADLECAGLGERLQQAHQMNANLAAERDRLKEGRDACAKTMAKMEQAKITIEMERDRLTAERDRLIQERDGGHWIHGRPSPQRAEYELLKGYWHDKWLVVEDKLRALRAELEKALDKAQQHMDERDALRTELEVERSRNSWDKEAAK